MKQHNYKVTALASAFKKFADMDKSSITERSKSEKMQNLHPDSSERSAKVIKKAKNTG